MSEIPIDEEGLVRLEDAMRTKFRVDENGDHHLVDGEFTLATLLAFYSEYDPAKSIPEGDGSVYDGVIYGPTDVIKVLIAEVRRLREQ